MGAEFLNSFITKTDELATRLRQWNEWRLEQLILQEKRTIELRIDQVSDTKAEQLAIQRLVKNKEWILSEERRSQLVERRGVEARKWLDWLFWKLRRSANTWTFFFLWTVVVGGWGWIGGINTPLAVICQTQTSLCYRMRIRDLKLALSNVPVSKCTKTSKGIVCPPKPTDETHKNSKKR